MAILNLSSTLEDFHAVMAERDHTIAEDALKIRALMREIDQRDNRLALQSKELEEIKARPTNAETDAKKPKKAKAK